VGKASAYDSKRVETGSGAFPHHLVRPRGYPYSANMWSIALKMLLGDKPKYFGLVFGVTFASLLMGQQVSVFISLMTRTAGLIFDLTEADIWVMDRRVRYIDEPEPIRDIELPVVRSVEGVEWAVPFYKGVATVRQPDGLSQVVILVGIDPVSLVGLANDTLQGDARVLLQPQTAMIDKNGYKFMWPGQDFVLGRELEVNDQRLVINAICNAAPTLTTYPTLYVSYTTITQLFPQTRNRLPFVVVKVAPGHRIDDVVRRIEQETGLQALPRIEFAWRSINYFATRTGIPINFGITVFLGVIIGAAITAQTFYLFVVENTKQFAAMKAFGVTNGQLFRLVMLQATFVGVVGYSLGMGLTALFIRSVGNVPAFRGLTLHWQVVAGAAVMITLIIAIAVSVSLIKVFRADPAMVFKG